ncbi:hypothetical protein ANO14919_090380 [Xylariales sp. No.14919]|nr:hypothetical protein ANO14919_090380 [Xylariales sp. No.14919]
MPAKKSIDGVASTYSTATSKPFELPALDLTFGSLTDGTNIPPPPPSPKEEQPPPQPRTVTKKENVEGQQLKPEANGATNGSIIGHDTSRPPSRTASVVAEEKKTKRGSGWFRRLRSHDHANDDKPATLQFENVTKKPIGPPPPMIPELSALETKVDTHLGDDLFKGIGRDL